MERTLVKLTLVCLATVALFVALFGFGCGGPQDGNSNGTPPSRKATIEPVKCDDAATDDAAILRAIYLALEDEKFLAMQEWQFNITVVKPEIKIVGWAPARSRDEIVELIKKVAPSPCKVNYDNFETKQIPAGHPNHRQAGCWPGYKPCGDICIPQDDPCHVLGEELPFRGANSNSNSNSNANTNINTNSNRIGNSKSNSNGNVNR